MCKYSAKCRLEVGGGEEKKEMKAVFYGAKQARQDGTNSIFSCGLILICFKQCSQICTLGFVICFRAVGY